MPQLDIILWFSQTFWFLIFCICFISFVFILYIPISCCIEGLPFFFLFKKYSRFFFVSTNSLI
jgi:hypothetical protein